MLVAGTAAEISSQVFLDGPRLLDRVVLEPGPGGHKHPWGADPALCPPFQEKGLLKNIETFRSSERFDGQNVTPLHLADRDKTTVDGSAIHEHRAGTTLSLPAALFGSGEGEILADDIDEPLEGVSPKGAGPAVDFEVEHF
jgi:hypothetical protein